MPDAEYAEYPTRNVFGTDVEVPPDKFAASFQISGIHRFSVYKILKEGNRIFDRKKDRRPARSMRNAVSPKSFCAVFTKTAVRAPKAFRRTAQ